MGAASRATSTSSQARSPPAPTDHAKNAGRRSTRTRFAGDVRPRPRWRRFCKRVRRAEPCWRALTQLEAYARTRKGEPCTKHLTTANGVPVADNQNSLTAGERGPIAAAGLSSDREAGALQPRAHSRARRSRQGLGRLRRPRPSRTTSRSTPRRSSSPPSARRRRCSCASRRSAARRARPTPSATRAASRIKFYTEEGNWDLVGNNTPVFFIRDPSSSPTSSTRRSAIRRPT